MVNVSNHTKCLLMNNQQCKTQPTLTEIHLINEYIQGLSYYPFAVSLNRCIGSCNNLNDLSNRVSVLNKKRRSKFKCFNVITETNELGTN